MNED
jgi:hypothetical protein